MAAGWYSARARTGRTRAGPVPSAPPDIRTTDLFGLQLAEVEYDDVVSLVKTRLDAARDEALTIDATNTMGMAESCLKPRMREALLSYDLLVPDGMPLVWCMNAKGARLSDRV